MASAPVDSCRALPDFLHPGRDLGSHRILLVLHCLGQRLGFHHNLLEQIPVSSIIAMVAFLIATAAEPRASEGENLPERSGGRIWRSKSVMSRDRCTLNVAR